MNLACVQCRQPLPITATFCSACGRPVDADKDGVPDALGNMIEAKARAIVAEEKRDREAALARDVAQHDLEALTREDSELQAKLGENARLPRSWFGAVFHTAVMTVIIGTLVWLVLGVPLHLLFSVIDVSPAGLMLCRAHCDTCSGPGRVYSWHFKGSWRSKNGQMGYALVCHNREIDIDKLTASDIRGRALNERLQPYMISGVTAYAIEGLVLVPSTAIVLGLLLATRRLRAFDVERTELTEQLRKNGVRRAALGAPVAEIDTFRG